MFIWNCTCKHRYSILPFCCTVSVRCMFDSHRHQALFDYGTIATIITISCLAPFLFSCNQYGCHPLHYSICSTAKNGYGMDRQIKIDHTGSYINDVFINAEPKAALSSSHSTSNFVSMRTFWKRDSWSCFACKVKVARLIWTMFSLQKVILSIHRGQIYLNIPFPSDYRRKWQWSVLSFIFIWFSNIRFLYAKTIFKSE